MMLGNRDLADLPRYLDSGRIDRREFFRNALVAGASVSLSAALAAVPVLWKHWRQSRAREARMGAREISGRKGSKEDAPVLS